MEEDADRQVRGLNATILCPVCHSADKKTKLYFIASSIQESSDILSNSKNERLNTQSSQYVY